MSRLKKSFFLICNPETATVVRCDRKPPEVSEVNLYGFAVPHGIWGLYKSRPGSVLDADLDLTPEQRARWVAAVECRRALRATAAGIMKLARRDNQ